MIKFLEKNWLPISILLVLGLLGAMIFLPGISRQAAFIVTLTCVGMAVTFAACGRLKAYHEEKITRPELARLLGLDLLGLVLAMGAAMLVGTLLGRPAGLAAAYFAESVWPGQGTMPGILVGLLIALLAGVGAGLLVHQLWGRLSTGRKKRL